jgi:hypothetical protein
VGQDNVEIELRVIPSGHERKKILRRYRMGMILLKGAASVSVFSSTNGANHEMWVCCPVSTILRAEMVQTMT